MKCQNNALLDFQKYADTNGSQHFINTHLKYE